MDPGRGAAGGSAVEGRDKGWDPAIAAMPVLAEPGSLKCLSMPGTLPPPGP